jgi:hypothetical protein
MPYMGKLDVNFSATPAGYFLNGIFDRPHNWAKERRPSQRKEMDVVREGIVLSVAGKL